MALYQSLYYYYYDVACRSTLQRTRSEPIPLPVQLLLQQHKMLMNKQQDQQLKENHKLYLKKACMATCIVVFSTVQDNIASDILPSDRNKHQNTRNWLY